jgi:hypothetical protein
LSEHTSYDLGDSDELSNIAKAVKARPRPIHEHDVGRLLGLGETVNRVAIRVPTKREQDLALIGAHEYVDRLSEKVSSAKNDPEILVDAKAAFIVAEACRRAADPEKMPTWPGGMWIHENLTSDQIATLLHIVNQVRWRESPTPLAIDDDLLEARIKFAAEAAHTDLPDMALSELSHAVLVQMFIMTASKLHELRAENAKPKP